MNNNKGSENPLVLSYLGLRRAIGILGISLPILLWLGGLLINQTTLQSSISSYYWTRVRDLLVGALVAFGVFLASYKGYRGDAIYGKIACVGAIGVAWFPTTPAGQPRNTIGVFHLVFTILFFATLIYFSYGLFTKTGKTPPTPKKLQRNLVYRICGILMALCVLGIVAVFFVPGMGAWLGGHAVFWLETFAIWAFGVSWFTKGEAIGMLNDRVEVQGP